MFRVVLAIGLLAFCWAQPEPVLFDNEPSIGGNPIDLPTTTPASPKPATYWITYNKNFRPGHPMVFQFQILKGSNPVVVNIALKEYNGNVALSKGPEQVFPNVLTSITLDIPIDMKTPSKYEYWYKVEISGKGQDMSFKETGQAVFRKKAFSIFVQTDKAMYKPSQTVKFRTLAMSPDMKVMKDVKQDIIVKDPKGNRILQYLGVSAPDNLGVVDQSFKLASSVPTGIWTINVNIEGMEEKKEFEVNDYVLPKFEVEIDGPPFGVADDLLYSFTVKAKYTFGKPVTDGKVKIEIRTEQWGWQITKRPLVKTGVLNSDGELNVVVTMKELIALARQVDKNIVKMHSNYVLMITAKVTETNTMREQSGSHEVPFHNTPIKMEVLGITPNSFKSGLDFTAYIEVRKQDGSLFTPREAKEITVLVNVTYNMPRPPETTTTPPPTEVLPARNESISDPLPLIDEKFPVRNDYYYPRYRTVEKVLQLDKTEYNVPDNGWILVTFRVPEEATSVTIKGRTVSPVEEAKFYHYVSKSHSPSESFLQLNVVNKKPKVGDTLVVEAKSTETMQTLNYQVSSKGLLLIGDKVSASNTGSFSFEITPSMSPSMSIVAFYVRDDGEFVVDALSLSVDGLFDNAVSIEFSKEKVQPGEDVDIIVSGEEDSVVFLLAVDKSVILLKSGNDITQDMVREELASYDNRRYGHWRYMFICGWPSYFGGDNAAAVFSSAGVVVLTDGTVYSRYSTGTGGKLPLPVSPEVDESADGSGLSGRDKISEKNTRTRKLFPENWLWSVSSISPNSGGKVTIPMKAPDTITSWVASVFSANPNTGLSVASQPAEVTTFRNLFISVDLPSSIVRYENFCFPVSVFSYYPEEIPIFLTLDQSPDFENIWVKKQNEEILMGKEQVYSTFFFNMRENEIQTFTYCFTPIVLGNIPIVVSATTDVDGLSDRVQRDLHVKPEGFPHTTTVSYLVEPVNGVWEQEVAINFPADTVSGSEAISVNVAGNLLGPIFDNLDDLLKKPYGCGEQNMINFSPIMSLLDFFFTTNTITEEIREKAVEYMLIGYQKEILYEHGSTGGYSTFGNSENTKENASTWLTAFVTKCFAQAELLDIEHKNILAIDTNLIERSAKWMLSQQASDGSFVEYGRVFNKGLQGGSGKGVSLTAYSIIALHHAQKMFNKSDNTNAINMIQTGLKKSVIYLESVHSRITDPYDVCITAYALNLIGSRVSNQIFSTMQSMAKRGSGMTYWERPSQQNKNRNYWWARDADALNIEMTAYALLTYSLRGIAETQGLPIIRWLSKQKGPNGGFISTQDTVIGIEALTSIAKDLYGAQFVPMTVTVKSKDMNDNIESKEFQVTKDNEMILQRKDIPFQSGGEIHLSGQAAGNANIDKSTVLVDVVFRYNVLSETIGYEYDMNHEIRLNSDGFIISVKVWTVDGKKASMTMLEVEIPAGHSPDFEAMKELNRGISSMDVKDDFLNIYINTDVIDGDGIKFQIHMSNTGGQLVDGKGKSLKVYNYYEPDLELTKEYFLVKQDYCTIVNDEICQFP